MAFFDRHFTAVSLTITTLIMMAFYGFLTYLKHGTLVLFDLIPIVIFGILSSIIINGVVYIFMKKIS